MHRIAHERRGLPRIASMSGGDTAPVQAPSSTSSPRFAVSFGGPIGRAWMLGGIGLLALFGQEAFDEFSAVPGGLLYTAAALLFGLVVAQSRRPAPTRSASQTIAWPSQTRHCLAAAVLATALVAVLVDTTAVSATVWALQAAAIALVLTAASFLDAEQPDVTRPLPRSPVDITTATTQVLLAAVLIGSAWVRFHRLGDLPRGFWYDEVDVGLLAQRIADEGYRPVFGGPVPAYDSYLIALYSSVFGHTVLTVRLVFATMGVALVAASYLVGRELFGKMGGLVLAFMIGFGRWPITLSRIGMNNIALPLFAMLTLGFVLRGHRRNSSRDYAFAGLSAGAGMLFYSAIAASLFGFGLFAAYLVWSSRGGKSVLGRRLLFGLAGAIVVVTPLAKFVVSDSERYFTRNRQTALWSDAGLLDGQSVFEALRTSLGRYLPMTSYRGDRNGRHNIPGEPMLPPLLSGLSLLGLGTVVLRVDRWVTALVMLWLPLAFAPGVLSLPWEAPNTLRASGVLPAAYLLATAAIVALARTVVRGTTAKHVFLGVLAAALATTGWMQVSDYFSSQQQRSDVWAVHSTPETIAAELTAAADDRTHVGSVAFLRNGRQLPYLSPERDYDDVFASDAQLPLYVPAGKDALLFATRESFDIGAQAERLYPNAEVQRDFDGLTADLFVIRIPSTDLAASHGWTEVEDGQHLAALTIEQTGNYQFRTATGGDLVVDGQLLRPCDAVTAVPLAAGLHLLSATTSDGIAPELQWIPPGTTEWQIVPADRVIRRPYVPATFRDQTRRPPHTPRSTPHSTCDFTSSCCRAPIAPNGPVS